MKGHFVPIVKMPEASQNGKLEMASGKLNAKCEVRNAECKSQRLRKIRDKR